jgi:hypothetical protein
VTGCSVLWLREVRPDGGDRLKGKACGMPVPLG